MFSRNLFGFNPIFLTLFPVWIGFIILDLVLKGVALWKSARNSQKVWFIFLLVVNSLGILPAIYILFFQKDLKKRKK